MGGILSVFSGKKKAAAAATPTPTPSGPIVKPLGANDPLRRQGKSGQGPFQDRIATILSDKLGN